MRSRISIRGFVCPSVRPSVRRSVRHTRVEFLRNGPNLNKIASGICHLKDNSKTFTRAVCENASVVRTLFDLLNVISFAGSTSLYDVFSMPPLPAGFGNESTVIFADNKRHYVSMAIKLHPSPGSGVKNSNTMSLLNKLNNSN